MNVLTWLKSSSPSARIPTEETPVRSCFFLRGFLGAGSAPWLWSSVHSSCHRRASGHGRGRRRRGAVVRGGGRRVSFLVLQEIRIHLQSFLDGERGHAKNLVEVHDGVGGLDHLRHAVDGPHLFHYAASSVSDTKSILFSRMRSAKATCCTASLTTPSGFSSSRCRPMCLASARQRMESMR